MTDQPITPNPDDAEDPVTAGDETPPPIDDMVPPADDDSASTPPPTPPPPYQPHRRLVRDPYSRLGGVASGVAHYFGFDVSLVRIVFVLLAFGTGFGFLAYLLAWLIIPRADHWPPAGARTSTRSLSRRDLGIGLAAGGLLLALAFGGGSTGSFLVPLLLVGGGVWLLLQTPPDETLAGAPTAGYAPVGEPVAATVGGPSASAYYVAPSPPGPPVPPRSRSRRVGIFVAVIVGIFALMILPLLILGGLLVWGFSAANFNDVVHVTRTPTSVEELPIDLDYEAAEIELDLTELSVEDLQALDDPANIDVDVDFGQVVVTVPDGLDVSVEADSVIGEVTVFDRRSSGFGNEVVTTAEDSDLEIDINLDVGEIVIVRG